MDLIDPRSDFGFKAVFVKRPHLFIQVPTLRLGSMVATVNELAEIVEATNKKVNKLINLHKAYYHFFIIH